MTSREWIEKIREEHGELTPAVIDAIASIANNETARYDARLVDVLVGVPGLRLAATASCYRDGATGPGCVAREGDNSYPPQGDTWGTPRLKAWKESSGRGFESSGFVRWYTTAGDLLAVLKEDGAPTPPEAALKFLSAIYPETLVFWDSYSW